MMQWLETFTVICWLTTDGLLLLTIYYLIKAERNIKGGGKCYQTGSFR